MLLFVINGLTGVHDMVAEIRPFLPILIAALGMGLVPETALWLAHQRGDRG